MLICGVKVSHDGGVAVLDGNRLVFSIEAEKLADGKRYSALGDLDRIDQILRAEGIDPADIDRYVVDGWYPVDGDTSTRIATAHHGTPVKIPAASYTGDGAPGGPLHRERFTGPAGSVLHSGYASYAHATHHVYSSYCTSPFAARGEGAYVLAWDGGMLPRLYRVGADPRDITYLGPLFPLVGDVFVEFCMSFDPFWRDISELTPDQLTQHHLEVPGKAMAYAALGTVRTDVFPALERLLDELNTVSVDSTIGQAVAARREELFPGMTSADCIATFQEYVARMLVDSLTTALARTGEAGTGAVGTVGLCLAGGCALNIKWNSALRSSGLFSAIWAPPFPNDSGAAIGTACCEMVAETGNAALEWDVYSGPRLAPPRLLPGWSAAPCDERELAALLHREGEPVVVLEGRAELGPRALGNRSIMAAATSPAMKKRLNDIKGRADYRPVAPMCLESHAAEVFEPGTTDPYMLFDHRLRPGWAEKIPAVVHLDGSARLQTIDPAARGTRAGAILHEYTKLSGIPVLCNTSANLSGHGLFSGVASAMAWGRTPYVWSEGTLYTNQRNAS
ncbi:nodulation protein U [Streptomyces daliensis]|uniref:Nodulation protein U n=1 Tax=Streptomyces daliensis TaxID=299421 RepID=A0A8T4ITQ7_9ACTN|nr:nodulation protein U [Streptomyces daliensis]